VAARIDCRVAPLKFRDVGNRCYGQITATQPALSNRRSPLRPTVAETGVLRAPCDRRAEYSITNLSIHACVLGSFNKLTDTNILSASAALMAENRSRLRRDFTTYAEPPAPIAAFI
jgi:hypothetical protein